MSAREHSYDRRAGASGAGVYHAHSAKIYYRRGRRNRRMLLRSTVSFAGALRKLLLC